MSSVPSAEEVRDLRWLVAGRAAHLFVSDDPLLAPPGHPAIEPGDLTPWPVLTFGDDLTGPVSLCPLSYRWHSDTFGPFWEHAG